MFKYLAALFMLIDHAAFYLGGYLSVDQIFVMRQVGRFAFPMFAYTVAKNISRTSHLPKYFLRLLAAATVTQLLFQVTKLIYPETFIFVNTIFTFALGLALVTGLRLIVDSSRDMLLMMRPATNMGENNGSTPDIQVPVNFGGITLPSWTGLIFGVILTTLSILTTWILEPDYGLYGIFMIALFFFVDRKLPPDSGPLIKANRLPRTVTFLIALTAFNLIYLMLGRARGNSFQAQFQLISSLAPLLFPLEQTREKKPGPFSKRFFYIFYPAHLVILMILSNFL